MSRAKGQGHRSHVPRSKVTLVMPSLKVTILADGLTSTSSWFISTYYYQPQSKEIMHLIVSVRLFVDICGLFYTFSHPNYCINHLDVNSSYTRFKEDRNYGRHIVTTKDIKIGTVVCSGSAAVRILLPDRYETHCYHCFKRTMAPVPCSKTSMVVFCSMVSDNFNI